MKFLRLLSPLVLFIIAIPFSFPGTAKSLLTSQAHKTLSTESDCLTSINLLVKDKDWLEQLINPILTSEKQVSDKLLLYSKIHQCLDDDPDSLSDDLKLIHSLTEYFLVFVGGFQTPSSQTSLYLESLDTSNNPAVIKIRNEAGIAPPTGFVYVRYYSSRNAMPEIVRRAFKNKEVVGVTMLMRYVAVLVEDANTWSEQVLQNQTVPETVSHELIHAYVNSVIGVKNWNAFPTWYNEGIAIYFSESGNEHTVVMYDFTISTTSPEDYHQYDLNFKYLEAKLGRKHLLELIKRSVDELNPVVLYHDLGLPDDNYDWLERNARAWEEQQNFHKGLIAAIVLAFLVLAIWWLFSGLPGLPVPFYVIVNNDAPETGLKLYEQPHMTSRILAVKPIGSRMRILDDITEARKYIGQHSHWVMVKDEKGRRGYILASHVREE